MTLDDIFNQLSYGELIQTFAGSGDSGLMESKDRPRIAASVYLGLVELHKRFLIKEATERVTVVEGTLTYGLTATDAQRIERMLDPSGNELTVNSIGDDESIRTPTLKSFTFPKAPTYSYVDVVYRATHPKLDESLIESAPEDITIDLPEEYLEPLLFYVASRVLSPIGISGQFHEGNNYTAKFEAACERLRVENIRVDSIGENDRLEVNGWV